MKILHDRHARIWFAAGCLGLGCAFVIVLVMAFSVFHMVLNPTH